jgi:hypothetical protein
MGQLDRDIDAIKAARARRDEAGSKLSVRAWMAIHEDPDAAKRIIVLRGHHDTSYYRAHDPEGTLRAFIRILRNEYGPNGPFDVNDLIRDNEESDLPSPGYDRADIGDLPDALQEEATAKMDQWERQVEEKERYGKHLLLAKKAIEEEDGELAYACFANRHFFDGDWRFEYLDMFEDEEEPS